MAESTSGRVDINDLSLETESVDINPTGDPFAFPPPPPEGKYRVKLKEGGRGWTKGTTKNGGQYLMAHIEARIIAPGERYDDNPLFDTASTLVSQYTGSSRVVGILQAFGDQIPTRATHAELARLLKSHLDAEAEVGVITQWEAYCKDCEKTVIRGEKRFPANGSVGGHKGTVECPKCHAELGAQARISRYIPAP